MACGLLLAILIAGSLTQWYMETLCRDLQQQLQENTSQQDFLSAKQRWEEHVAVLSMLIRHDRIDNITEAFARADSFRKKGTEDEYRAEVAQIISKLTWLSQYDRPNLRSIF